MVGGIGIKDLDEEIAVFDADHLETWKPGRDSRRRQVARGNSGGRLTLKMDRVQAGDSVKGIDW